MAQVSGIEVKFSADTTQFDRAVTQTETRLTKFSSFAKTSLVAVGAAGVTAATGLGLATRAALNYADEIGKMAQKVGMSTESLSRLEYAARLSDVSLGQLQVGLGQLAKNMEAGSAGLDALGISAMTTDGRLRSTNEVFLEVAERFASIEDGAGKTAIAMNIFGRSGADLIPLLNSGRDGLAEMATEADRLGITISGSTARSAERFNDSLTRINAALGGLTNQIAAGAAPRMADLTERMIDFYKESNIVEGVVKAIDFVMTELAKAAVFLSQAFTEVTEAISFVGAAANRLANADFAGVGEEWAASQERVRQALVENSRLMDEINGKVQTVNREGKGDLPTPREAAPSLPETGGGLSKQATDEEKLGIYREEDPFFIDRLQTIRDNFKTEREVLAEEYALNQETVRNALNNGLIEKAQFDALELQMAEDHQKKLNAIKMAGIDTQLSATADLFGSLAQLTDGGNKKLVKLSKAFAIAQVVINTAQGISKAFAQFGWPAGIGPAAAVAASGAVQLANIASAESGKIKSGGGGGGRGSTASAGGGAGGGGGGSGPTTTFSFTLMNDPMGFGEKFARQFIDQLNSTQRNGGQIRGVIA